MYARVRILRFGYYKLVRQKGRMLKKSGSMDIGVIIPTISNPFYAPIVPGIELEAGKRGYKQRLKNMQ